ncbi:MAG: hypothetical protein NTV20_00285, partial [Candidatus Shapirobacteria bacterium]|nr:hypothetical protein [Candidatus Shapirobacteria bacterium]
MDLIISDETLRDGEQQVGVNFSISQKYKLANDILNTGVDQLAIMPWVSKHEEQLAKKILKSKIDTNKVYASSRLGKKFIDYTYNTMFQRIDIEIDKFVQMVAKPGHPHDDTSVESVKGTKIDSAFLGSCTN